MSDAEWLVKLTERLRARATLYKEDPRNDEERAVGRSLDEVADAIEETIAPDEEEDLL